tara:strand:+ start:656 stop:1048 length:393 start_codon:yes stop_codon:yes gene_type:complete
VEGKMKYIFLVGFSVIWLTGCFATPSSIKASSNAKLCADYNSTPDYNVWKSKRLEEIYNRGLNCAGQSGFSSSPTYSGGSANSGAKSASTCFKSSETSQGTTKLCVYNCTGNIHSITVGRVDICPLTVQR